MNSVKPLLLLSLLGLAGTACDGYKVRRQGAGLTANDLQAAFVKLKPCTQAASTGNDLDAYIDFVKDLQSQPQADVRAALVDLFESGDYAAADFHEEAVAYTLLRIYFDVPPSVPRSQAEFFGGPVDASELGPTTAPYQLSIPLELSSSGTILSVQRCGSIGAPVYVPVGEFDYFDQTLGLGLRDLSAY